MVWTCGHEADLRLGVLQYCDWPEEEPLCCCATLHKLNALKHKTNHMTLWRPSTRLETALKTKKKKISDGLQSCTKSNRQDRWGLGDVTDLSTVSENSSGEEKLDLKESFLTTFWVQSYKMKLIPAQINGLGGVWWEMFEIFDFWLQVLVSWHWDTELSLRWTFASLYKMKTIWDIIKSLNLWETIEILKSLPCSCR